MDADKRKIYDLMKNFFCDCEKNGSSDFAVWCEDNIENERQDKLCLLMTDHVNAIADLLF
jgi:hypothetical protein